MPIDPTTVARLTAELAATSYHRLLAELLHARIAQLLVDDVTDPYVAMKRRGQVEELQRLIVPLFVKSLALTALARRAQDRAGLEAARAAESRRDWWSEPIDEHPVP